MLGGKYMYMDDTVQTVYAYFNNMPWLKLLKWLINKMAQTSQIEAIICVTKEPW